MPPAGHREGLQSMAYFSKFCKEDLVQVEDSDQGLDAAS